MKKLIFVSLLMVLATLTACGPKYMVKTDPCPDVRGITAQPGKAALVVGRTTFLGSGVNFENYLDRQFIGTTKGHSFFVSTVEPGDHYVTAHGENYASMLLRFEPNKTYYIQNEVRFGAFIARAKLDFVDAQHLYNDMDGHCDYYVKDPSEKVDDLNDEEWKWAKEDYSQTEPINAPAKNTVAN